MDIWSWNNSKKLMNLPYNQTMCVHGHEYDIWFLKDVTVLNGVL